MYRRIKLVALCSLSFSMSALSQNTVTTGGGSTNTVPVFTGATTLGNSTITQSSGGNIGIGNTNPLYTLDVAGDMQTSSTGLIGAGLYRSTSPTLAVGDAGYGLSAGGGVMYLWDPGNGVKISHKLLLDGYGFVSSIRQEETNFSNLFLGGSISESAGGSYAVQTDGGSNYFAAIRMDNAGGNVGAINFYTGASVGGSSYTLTNAQLASHMKMTIVGNNVGIGTGSPTASLEVNGTVKLTSGSGASITFPDSTVQSTAWNGTTLGGDYAESVDVSGDTHAFSPGDVLTLDTDDPGTFLKSARPYSTLVAGIYSTKPGLVGRRQSADRTKDEKAIPMAMIGIVPTKVSAENGPIKTGDLLVTSATPGYAMKGTDRNLLTGAIVGKAIGKLDSGTGMIEVLVTLQ